ncbi:hypothetical protein [Sphingomonas baiyangensis]|uniref:Uncharacterized protein n=1 Tax=Sphingomonas baiyangensis TaxID=2572576 RepID=A0A4U1L9R3_9SPHN|nr:hypothetical protein [Sphingomonas baiyangensis]TKD53323.1 hypothetical protein FBR43_03100 [Sphingomonas baiyangensis]
MRQTAKAQRACEAAQFVQVGVVDRLPGYQSIKIVGKARCHRHHRGIAEQRGHASERRTAIEPWRKRFAKGILIVGTWKVGRVSGCIDAGIGQQRHIRRRGGRPPGDQPEIRIVGHTRNRAAARTHQRAHTIVPCRNVVADRYEQSGRVGHMRSCHAEIDRPFDGHMICIEE